MTSETYNLDLALAVSAAEGAARAAGALIRYAFKNPRKVDDKGTNDLVTETDRASETLVSRLLHNAFPQCNVAGEEGIAASNIADAPATWWIDPLDGTTNFVHGIPRFSVSIGCIADNGDFLVGVVYDPMFEECFTAVRGRGAACNGEPIGVSTTMEMSKAIAASGFPADLRQSNNNTAEWAAFVSRCQGMTRMGSAALDLCYIASGRFDVYWEYGLKPWDVSAGVLIVLEAGGLVTNYAGQPIDVHKREGLLATNGRLHQQAVDILALARQ
jgi:myo-inositol-1(or 4)-monophosphatase